MPTTRPLLIVEDEENDVFFLKRALEKAGILNPVYSVGTGQEAIDYLSGAGHFSDRSRYPLPFLVLLDLKLPCLNGTEVLKWIRTQSPLQTLLVLILSSSTLATDLDEAYRSGANAYFVKPADPEQLLGCIQDFANWWLRRNVPPP